MTGNHPRQTLKLPSEYKLKWTDTSYIDWQLPAIIFAASCLADAIQCIVIQICPRYFFSAIVSNYLYQTFQLPSQNNPTYHHTPKKAHSKLIQIQHISYHLKPILNKTTHHLYYWMATARNHFCCSMSCTRHPTCHHTLQNVPPNSTETLLIPDAI